METTVSGLETTVGGLETTVVGLTTTTSTLTSDLLFLNTTTLPLMVLATGTAGGVAADALVKANRSLDIWEESGNNVYHKKSGNVGIGITFADPLTNKLEVNGDINIPIGSSYRINNIPLIGSIPIESGSIIGITNNTLNIVDRLATGSYPVVTYPILTYEPIITPPLYETFTYLNNTTSSQETHTFTLSEQTQCNVLIVGGGGAGDRQAGGGGGGGAVCYECANSCWNIYN